MGILQILNIVTGAVTVAGGLIPDIIAIKNALSKDGSNFQVTISTLNGDTIQTTGSDISDIDVWNAAHPA